MRYAIVIEKAGGNYSAYLPDLPGCVATGDTVEAVESEIRDAIRFHIQGLKEDASPNTWRLEESEPLKHGFERKHNQALLGCVQDARVKQCAAASREQCIME